MIETSYIAHSQRGLGGYHAGLFLSLAETGGEGEKPVILYDKFLL